MTARQDTIGRIVVGCALVVAVLQGLSPRPFGWLIVGALVVIAIWLSIPSRVPCSGKGVYNVAVVSPFSGWLLVWYLAGRTTLDGRAVRAQRFRSIEEFSFADTTWHAILLYEDHYPAFRRLSRQELVPIILARRLPAAVPVAIDPEVRRAKSPVDVLSHLPIDRMVAHPGSTRVLVVLMAAAAIFVLGVVIWKR
jgi:hypothetical protein